MEKEYLENVGYTLEKYQGKIVEMGGTVNFEDRKGSIAYFENAVFLYEQDMPVQEEQKKAMPITEEFQQFLRGDGTGVLRRMDVWRRE